MTGQSGGGASTRDDVSGAIGPARQILIIGIGAGHPDHVTLQAIAAMNRADVFFIPEKGTEKEALAGMRHAMLDRHVSGAHRRIGYSVPKRGASADYSGDVVAWHDAIADTLGRLVARELKPGETGAFLVWGDPALYDSMLRIIERLPERAGLAIGLEVIPGISAVQALTAAHKVTLNAIGRAVLVSNGRLPDDGFPTNADSLVLMLNAEKVLKTLDGDLDVYWGANLGMPEEALVAGRLAEVIGEIERRRAEVRAERGWVMDTALVKRPG